MRRAAKVDLSQPLIVEALRENRTRTWPDLELARH